jgi:type IV pilus assembly protein PilC
MVTLLEPVMIVGLGGLIGLIIMSVLMPMFEVLGSIG